jgi:ketosteroid isomerase-like protein/quercetin dioxygenase-like cupin family protein
MRRWMGLLIVAGLFAGCNTAANVDQDRETVTRLEKEWSASTKDPNKFVSYYAPDATVYPQGMPLTTGAEPIRKMFTEMAAMPGFALEFTPTKTEVSSSGDLAYTAGTYQGNMGGVQEKGKYITIWKKQADGQWKAKEDIFNADAPAGPPATTHVMVQPAAITWMDPPPSLPPGSKIAVISGDPSKPAPFVIRAQVPAGYKVPPHWHPGDENLTVLSGTVALGMGDAWDEAKMQTVGAGGYVGLPAQMRHSFLAKTAATFQVHGMGPFVVNYVNPADDPSKK